MPFIFSALTFIDMNNNITLIIYGVIIGVVSGILIGRYSVYYKVNKHNNLTADNSVTAKTFISSGTGPVKNFIISFFSLVLSGVMVYGCYDLRMQGVENWQSTIIIIVALVASTVVNLVFAIKKIRRK